MWFRVAIVVLGIWMLAGVTLELAGDSPLLALALGIGGTFALLELLR